MTMHVRLKTLLLLVSPLLLVVDAAHIEPLKEGRELKLNADEEVSHDDSRNVRGRVLQRPRAHEVV